MLGLKQRLSVSLTHSPHWNALLSFVVSSNQKSLYTTNVYNESLKEKRLKKYNEFIERTNVNVQDIALNTLQHVPFAKPSKKRVGRGEGSGLGRTCGRGIKGQKSRSGHNIPHGFEGGQTPLYRRVPKYGFNNKKFALDYHPVSLEKIQYMIDTGRIDVSNGETITMKTLKDAGIIRNVKFPGVKLLAKGVDTFKTKIDIEVPRASKKAIKAIEKAGGNIRCIYYNKKALWMLLKGYCREDVLQSMAIPPPKLYEYYLREDIRGYLSDAVSTNRFDLVPDEEEEETKKRGEKYASSTPTAAKATSAAVAKSGKNK
jgi:large subunit ribosomal protein L15